MIQLAASFAGSLVVLLVDLFWLPRRSDAREQRWEGARRAAHYRAPKLVA
jgi:hypothetical protein